jgi:hypothetical protein
MVHHQGIVVKVAFPFARQDPKYAQVMVASVKRHMPNAEILQLTDDETPEIQGCRAVRMKWQGDDAFTIFKLKHLVWLSGDVLVLDSDVVVQADLSPVFELPFDVAATWRDGPIKGPKGDDITKIMPINTGVMFCRNHGFWSVCLQFCGEHFINEWCADQLSAPAAVRQFNTLRLHCDNFNYTPKSRDEDVSQRLVVHYKGDRKEWMLK